MKPIRLLGLAVLGLVFVCFLSQVAQAGFFYGKQKYYTIKTEHFYIHFPGGQGSLAGELRQVAEEEHTRLVQRIGWEPKERTHVVLSDKSEQANGLSTVIPYNYILLYTAIPDADSTLDHYKNYLRLLFTHEYTHILHIDQAHKTAGLAKVFFGKIIAPNGATPGWMREGYAVYEESQLDDRFGRLNFDYTEMFLRTAVYENKFPRIDQITGVQKHFPGSDGAYLFGSKFMEWLALKHGEERIYEFQKLYGSSLWTFSLNNKARRIFGKSFYKLWDEFKAETTARFNAQKTEVEQKAITTFESVVETKDTQSAFVPRPGTDGYAYFQESFDDGNKIVIQPTAADKPLKIARNVYGQMAFSHTGKYLAFGSTGTLDPKTTYVDVYYYDLETKKLERVADADHAKTSMRAMDPDFSPEDGGERWIVMVRNFNNTDQLEVFDLKEKKGYVVTNELKNTQFSNPRFSPDGQKIVVSRKDPQTGFRDIVVYSKKGALVAQITNDIAPDNHPIFSRNGSKIYFDSYRTGIANIFAFDLKKKTFTQITNVLDGVFEPVPALDGSGISVRRYSSEHQFIQKFDPAHAVSLNDSSTNEFTNPDPRAAIARFAQNPDAPELLTGFLLQAKKTKKEANKEETQKQTEYPSLYKDQLGSFPSTHTFDTTNPADAEKYQPFPQVLVPRYLMPGLMFYENAVVASAMIGRSDPLFRHSWAAYGNYRSDAAFLGAGATYVYSRWDPSFYVGALRYAVDWGDVNGTRFFEERNQVYGGTSYAWGHQAISLGYFYEDRSAFTDLAVNLTNMEPYAGMRFQYSLSNFKNYDDSISPENGYNAKVAGEWTDTLLGSDEVNEEFALRGDLRWYLEMPWSDHQVWATRVAVGWAWGDQQQFGTYRLGGPFGEGTGASYSSRVFPLRGLSGITFGGDQVTIFSTEYRIPIATNANFGIGTWPIFVNKVHLALFCDGGDTRYRTDDEELFDRFLVAVGAEVSGDFVIGYGLPLTGRMGYGVVVMNRDRIAGLTDSITGMDLQNGSFYLQLGTMF